MRIFLSVAAILIAASTSFASGLIAPITLESAQVMPKGVRSFRLAGFTSEIDNKYNTNGQIVPLGQDINKAITVKDMLASQPAGFERGMLKGGIESMGFKPDDVIGQANGSVSTRITTTVPVFVYGLTDKLTLAAIVPVIYSNLSVSTGWTANSNMQSLTNYAVGHGLRGKMLSFEPQFQNVIATKLSMLGYKPLVNETHTDIGDMTLAAKYQVEKSDHTAISIAPRVTVPTGRPPDSDKVVDVAGGDGQWDVGATAAFDYIFSGRFTATYALAYTYQFARDMKVHLPNSWDDTLSADIDEHTNQKFGDIAGTSLGARYKVASMWTVGGAYSFQFKGADSYSGSAFAPERYQYLSYQTEQFMHAVQLNVVFSTIDAFLAKKFLLPFEASVGYSKVLAGRNAPMADLTSFELASFF